MTEQQSEITAELHKAVIGSWYPLILASPYAAATRAQSAFTVSTFAASALLATGVLTGISSRPPIVQWLGATAFVLWLITAALFLRVSTTSPSVEASSQTKVTVDEFVTMALGAARGDAKQVAQGTRAATMCAMLAMAASVAAFALGYAVKQQAIAEVWLHPRAMQALDRDCRTTDISVTGRVDLTQVSESAAPLRIDLLDCDSADSATLSRTEVIAITILNP